jgi:Gas vesicle synthesis protein GvpO/Gas vesicle protein G
MILVDNLLAGPGQAAMFVLKELARKAQEDWLDDDAIKKELQEIYALAEAGKISTQEFEERECNLLERLEQIARARFNDKWGNSDGTVIEVEAMTKSLTEAAAEAPIEMETPWQLDAAPTIVAAPAIVAQPAIGSPYPIITPRVPAAPTIAAAAPVMHTRAVVHAPPPPVAPVVAPPPAAHAPAPVMLQAPEVPVAFKPLTINQVVECTTRALSLLNLKLSVITSVAPEDSGWHVTAELVERRGVPDTNDLIGVYDLRLDPAGSVTRYERTRLRRRGDLGR